MSNTSAQNTTDVENVSVLLEQLVLLYRQRGHRGPDTVDAHSKDLFNTFKAILELKPLKRYQKLKVRDSSYDQKDESQELSAASKFVLSLRGSKKYDNGEAELPKFFTQLEVVVKAEKLGDPRLKRILDEAKKESFASSVGLITLGVTSVKNVSNLCEDVGNVLQNFGRVFVPVVEEVPFVRTLVGALEGIYRVVKDNATLKETIQTLTKQVVLLLGVLQQPSVRPLITENAETDELLKELLCVIADFSETVHDYQCAEGVRKHLSTQRVREELDKKVEAITNHYSTIRDRVTLDSVGAIYRGVTGVTGLQQEALSAISKLTDWTSDKMAPAVDKVLANQTTLSQAQQNLQTTMMEMRGSLGDQVQNVQNDVQGILATNNTRAEDSREIAQRLLDMSSAVTVSSRGVASLREGVDRMDDSLQSQLKAIFSQLETVRSLIDTNLRAPTDHFHEQILQQLSTIGKLLATLPHGAQPSVVPATATQLAAHVHTPHTAQVLDLLREAEERHERQHHEVLAALRETQVHSQYTVDRTAQQQAEFLKEVRRMSDAVEGAIHSNSEALRAQSARKSNWEQRFEDQLRTMTEGARQTSQMMRVEPLRTSVATISLQPTFGSTQVSTNTVQLYVWATESGKHYHSRTCRWGEGYGNKILYNLARERYNACSYCSGEPSSE